MGNSLWWGLLLLYAGGFISLLALEGPHRAKKSAGEQEPEPGCGSCCAGADGGCQKIQIGDGDCDSDSDCAGNLMCGDNNCGREEDFDISSWPSSSPGWDTTDDCCCRLTSNGTCTTIPLSGEETVCLDEVIRNRNEPLHAGFMTVAIVAGLLAIYSCALGFLEGRENGVYFWAVSSVLLLGLMGAAMYSAYYGPAPGSCDEGLLIAGDILAIYLPIPIFVLCVIGFKAYCAKENMKVSADASTPHTDPYKVQLAADLIMARRAKDKNAAERVIDALGGGEHGILQAFMVLDKDVNGYVTAAELRRVIPTNVPVAEVNAMLREADLEDDGRLNYEEFIRFVDPKGESWSRTMSVIKAIGKQAKATPEAEPIMTTVVTGTVVEAEPAREPPPLHDIVDALKQNLGLDGTWPEVVDAACLQLGVAPTGSLQEKGDACWRAMEG